MMNSLFWTEFVILFIAALIGGVAILPYSKQMIAAAPKKRKISTQNLVLLASLQTAIISVVAIIIGLFTAHATGHGAPYIDAAIKGQSSVLSLINMLEIALGLGVLSGLVLLIADLFFLPHFPKQLLDMSLKTSLPENFAASFYGGINEEILMRLFGLSLIVWLISTVIHFPSTTVFWIANIFMAIIFGLGHLPALKGMLGKITKAMFFRSLLLNAPVGLICGWLFWYYGIEAAIVAHFSADIIYHVGGTTALRYLNKHKLILK